MKTSNKLTSIDKQVSTAMKSSSYRKQNICKVSFES